MSLKKKNAMSLAPPPIDSNDIHRYRGITQSEKGQTIIIRKKKGNFAEEVSVEDIILCRLPIRPVTRSRVVCRCLDISSVNYFCFLKTSTLQLGMVEHLKVRQNCHKIENHYFQFIHMI